MLNKISSSNSNFKEVEFHEGINILVTQKMEQSQQTNTRNGSGKSSLIDIIHFVFGSSITTNSIFKKDALKDTTFKIDFTTNNIDYTVERSTAAKSPIRLITHLSDKKIIDEEPVSKMNKKFLEILFGTNNENASFRGSFSYFVRQESSGGFLDASEVHKKQKKITKQAALTFLLGLDTKIPLEWKELSTKENELKILKRALKNKTVNMFKSEAQIKTSLTILEEKIRILENQIKNFQILPEYKDLEKSANKLTELINNATNYSQILSLQIIDIKKSIDSEHVESNLTIEELYGEINLVLPNNVTKRFEDVKKFHSSVIRNRKNYLLTEIKELSDEIQSLHTQIEIWDSERSEKMNTLQNKGALDQYSKIQEKLNSLKSEQQILNQQFNTISSIDLISDEMVAKENELQKMLIQDFIDNDEVIKKAILSFSHATQYLYGPDDLAEIIIDSKGKDGINIEILKSDKQSKGINNMMIFCFDMMLMEINTYLERPIDFIIHDSHMFDGVDERQISLALEYAKIKSNELNFQYITMLNSDIYESLNTDFEEARLNIDISDASENGGLFGFRF